MLMRIYGIYDSKAEAYLQPFFSKSKGEAIRSITTLVNEDKHNFSVYAEDFTLFELGTFEEDTGTMTAHEAKQNLGVFGEFKRSNMN